MANERITEDMVDDLLRTHGFYDDLDTVIVEKQQSAVEAIRSALAKAGKAGMGGRGYPEFIITSPTTPDMVVIIECKADLKLHESPQRDKPVEYAVDGVLHYARYLSPNYTTIAIAVSGNKKSSRWTFMLIPKGEVESRDLTTSTGATIRHLVPLSDLIAAASFDPAVQSQRTRDLIQFSMDMHVFMREAEMSEQEKPLAVAGTLIALANDVFRDTYDKYPADELPAFWMQTIKKEITKAKIPMAKVDNMVQPFTNIEVQPELRKPTKGYPKGLLNEIVRQLAERVLPFLTIYHDFDVVGQF